MKKEPSYIRCKDYIKKDCEFYCKDDCRALSELICETKVCSFYKPMKKGVANGQRK